MYSAYEAAGGSEGMHQLAEAWHCRVMSDEIFAHAFGHGFEVDHTERLAAYLGETIGGPSTYTERYGDETHVVRIQSGNGEHSDMDNRAIRCFDEALSDLKLDRNEQLRRTLHDYFAWAARTTMSRYHGSSDDVPNEPSAPALVTGRPGSLARPGLACLSGLTLVLCRQ
jgi:hemoglobin